MTVTPNLPKGMRDFLPEDVLARERIMKTIKRVFESYGFSPLSTPAVERIEILSGKAGEEVDSLMFKILKRGKGAATGEADLGLRYELTISLARFMAMNPNLMLPFKRYQMERVWRAERPQRGRYREFMQCDVDIVGSHSLYADAEIITLTYRILSELGFADFTIYINHRALIDAGIKRAGIPDKLSAAVAIAIDKMDKIGKDGVLVDLERKGIAESCRTELMKLMGIEGDNKDRFTQMEGLMQGDAEGKEALANLRELFDIVQEMGVPDDKVLYDPFLIRGMSYYTGPVFESRVDEPKIGSVTGGGRYDNLIGLFKGEEIPATGTTIGFERIVDVMRELDMIPTQRTKTHVMVTIFDEELKQQSLILATELRRTGLACEMYLIPGDKMKKQLRYADERGIPLAVILGPDELENDMVTLKELSTREQHEVAREDLYWKIAEILNL